MTVAHFDVLLEERLPGLGAITRDEKDEWFIYTQSTLDGSRWRRVGSRGFVPPEAEISALAPELQEPARQIYHAGVVPRLASLAFARLNPGEYYPRIWRGRHNPSRPFEGLTLSPEPLYGGIFIRSVTSAVSLFDELIAAFRFVEPDSANMCAFGHRFRELIILACTEVEANLRGVYVENFCPGTPELTPTTRDYVRLKSPLALDLWSVGFKQYPEIASITPFEMWSEQAPTKSLPWYSAYNAVKHDREGHFSEATLAHALSAMAALHIILCAQWGPGVFSRLEQNYPSPFFVRRAPSWSSADYYVPPIESRQREAWRKIPYGVTP